MRNYSISLPDGQSLEDLFDTSSTRDEWLDCEALGLRMSCYPEGDFSITARDLRGRALGRCEVREQENQFSSVVDFFDANGILAKRLRFYDYLLCDGAEGEPAVIHFDRYGDVERIAHFIGGALHDPKTGEPALVDYYPGTKQLRHAEHYLDGLVCDTFEGGAAVKDYHPDGRLAAAEHVAVPVLHPLIQPRRKPPQASHRALPAP